MNTAQRVALPAADGVWRITTPLPFRPRAVHAYLVRLDAGWMLVDGGLGTGDAWGVLDQGVRSVAGEWSAVRLQVVTHMHVDHVGLAGRVRRASAAVTAMGALDGERMRHAAADPDDEARYRAELLRAAGAPPEVLGAVEAQRATSAGLAPAADVDLPLRGADGPLPGAPGWRWLWTPGHTAGHVALAREEDGTVLAGDAVMEGITPTLGVNRQRADPVGDYLQTLDRLEGLGATRLLAGHGPAASPGRIRELRDATLAEAAVVAARVGRHPATAWQVTAERYRGRDLPPAQQMLALRETRAHLDRLSGPDGPLRRTREAGVDWFARFDALPARSRPGGST